MQNPPVYFFFKKIIIILQFQDIFIQFWLPFAYAIGVP